MKCTTRFSTSLIGGLIVVAMNAATATADESTGSEDVEGQKSDGTTAQQGPERREIDVFEAFIGEQPLEWEPGEIIVKLRPGVNINSGPARGLKVTGGMDFKALERAGRARRTSGGEFVIQVVEDFSTMSADEIKRNTELAMESVVDDPLVEYAQRNYIYQPLSEPMDPRFASQWHYRMNGGDSDESPGGINLPAAWQKNVGSREIVVAVLDTGIVADHEDIQNSMNLAAGYDMITSTARANDGDGRDPDPTDTGDGVDFQECGFLKPARGDSWHGTHVAGTVGVGITNNDVGVAGVAWEVRVQNVRVLGKCGGSTVDINDAIRWAAGLDVPRAERNATPARVINMSLGGPTPCSRTPALQAAINDAVAAGVTVVVAAGNSAVDAAQFNPASCENVITVAASDFEGKLVGWYSNHGDDIDIMAPGGDRQADLDGDGDPDGVLSMVSGGYEYMNGTSMAAPHVAGVAALMLSMSPGLSPAEVKQQIKENAIPRSAADCPNACGAGLLNADF